MTKNELFAKRTDLQNQLDAVNQEISVLESNEKPFVAAISSYSGGGSLTFKTEAQARKKYEEYCKKNYYRNGLSYGAYLYKNNEDGAKTLIDYKPMGHSWFYPDGFEKEQEQA